MDDDLLTIGRFGRLARLSVTTLRHWDAEGLLRPAVTDPVTGYRRYRADQVQAARTIAALRDLDLPIVVIRQLLDADPAARDAVLRAHRSRLEARAVRLNFALHQLRTMTPSRPSGAAGPPAGIHAPPPSPSSQEEIAVPTPPMPPELDRATHRALGAGLYNRTWQLLEREDRTPDEEDELVHAAHASAWHWRQASEGVERARGEWLCARVYAMLGRAPAAVAHARRCLDLLDAGAAGVEDWDRAAAAEAMARALAVAGDERGAAEWRGVAVAALDAIADPEDRAVIEQDLGTLPV